MALGTRLFVGNLPENTEENDLQCAFSVFGSITNLDLKIKSGGANTNDSKKFAFVTISASNTDVESCIKHFANEDFKGSRLYVTRARESFLERLQRERDQTQKKETEKHEPEILPKHNPVIKLSDKLNPRKRKIDYVHSNDVSHDKINHNKGQRHNDYVPNLPAGDATSHNSIVSEVDKKKHDSEKKRLESMKKKRQEFKEKQMIIKTGLIGIDKVQNKKVKFSDDEDVSPKTSQGNNKTLHKYNHKNVLFEDDDNENDDGVNFDIKKQFEGKKGQKVLDLQSRYKSDKRFTLDERFIDDDDEDGKNEEQSYENGETEINHADEKAKQMIILQDLLGVSIKSKVTQDQDSKKTKPKLGMLRFDPMQPEHAKFLAPVEMKQEPNKKSKKKSKEKQENLMEEPPQPEVPKVEVSKEQFYKVSETLKEAIAQPNTFSFRSMFGNNEEGPQEQETDYIPLAAPKAKKVKNPLDPKEKNPFVYDSSDSEAEEVEKEVKTDLPPATEPKAVWKENLFFSMSEQRILEGLAFFSKRPETEGLKERRELKSLMKKRIYNKDRKNQMFQKKIGGRKKAMKKPYKNKG